MRASKSILISILGIGIASVIVVLSRGHLISYIGAKNRDKLEKIGAGKCLENQNGFQSIRTCLTKLGEDFEILGDTTEGNFRVVFSKPYAHLHLDAKNWKLNGTGAGILDTYTRPTCFIHQGTEVPELGETEKEVLAKYFGAWIKQNPEAFKRFVSKVEETESEVIIHSAPFEAFKNYAEYCPDWISIKYLDDYKNQELNIIAIKK